MQPGLAHYDLQLVNVVRGAGSYVEDVPPVGRIWKNADVTQSFPDAREDAEDRTPQSRRLWRLRRGRQCASRAHDHCATSASTRSCDQAPPTWPSGSEQEERRGRDGGTDEEPAPNTTATAVSTTTTATTEPGASEAATEKKAEKPKKVRKSAPKRALLEYHEVTKPIALVDGLAILGRGDIFTKRKWWLPENDPQIVECADLGITSTVAAQMQRSLEYSKRENRPRIICKSVDQYCIESR